MALLPACPHQPPVRPSWRRWLIIAVVSYIELLTYAIKGLFQDDINVDIMPSQLPSVLYSPGLPEVRDAFHDVDGVATSLSLTIYVFGFMLGPLLIAPLSELYGRAVVYRWCICLYLICTIACALAANLSMLIVFRLLAGCTGSAPLTLGVAVVADLTTDKDRGRVLSLYSAGPLVATSFGPVLGGYIIQAKGWRWAFWLVAILAGIAMILSFLVLEETNPRLLDRKTVPCEHSELEAQEGKTRGGPEPTKRIADAFGQPLRLLFKTPPVLVIAVVQAVASGIANLLFVTLSATFQNRYDFPVDQAGWTYLAVSAGAFLAIGLNSYASDRIVKILKNKSNGDSRPEFRLPIMFFALPVAAIGMIWYGWSADQHLPWAVAVTGLVFFGVGIMIVQMTVSIYLVDSYSDRVSSVMAANTVVRSIGAAFLPMAGNPMMETLGLGLSGTVLAGILLVLSPIAPLLYMSGRRIRDQESGDKDELETRPNPA